MPSTKLRQNVLGQAKKVVVKLGSQLLAMSGDAAGLDAAYLSHIAAQVATLRQGGREVTLVSSGAIAAGCLELGLKKRPRDVAALQAVAAVGQRLLMTQLHTAFTKHDLHVGQLLLTRNDFDDRLRYLNIRNCVAQLHQQNCIPVVNENDTVAVEEIRFGDNDQLAALMCNALRADALVLLTVVDGLLDADGHCMELVENIASVKSLVSSETSATGTGGMSSKLDAAGRVMEAGELAVIANGRTDNVLLRLFNGEKLGTIFVPAKRKLDSRQRWISLTKRPGGKIIIDDGAAAALQHRGKSLLAIGVVDVQGNFERGDVIVVQDKAGNELARGITNYAGDEVRLIAGKRSNQFEKLLGRSAYDEVIHRDHLVVTPAE